MGGYILRLSNIIFCRETGWRVSELRGGEEAGGQVYNLWKRVHQASWPPRPKEYSNAKKTLLRITRTDDEDDLALEELDVVNILPDKFDNIQNKDSIDISYLRPDSNQETEELLLPLPLWARRKQLDIDILQQEDVDPEDIFGKPEEGTVDLQFIGRKRGNVWGTIIFLD